VLYTWAIPLYHTGLLASGNFSEAVTWSLGITDGFNNVIENNDGKAYLAQLTATSGPLFGAISGFFGSEASENTAGIQPGSVDDWWIFDLITTFTPNDRMSFWLNADLGTVEDLNRVSRADLATPVGDEDPEYWGVAIGGKFQLTDKLGFALRGEYFEDDENIRATAFGISGVDGADVEIMTLTGTLSYAFTQNLLLRGELRWDQADNSVSSALPGGDGEIFLEGNHVDDSSVLGLVEVSYIFD